MEVIEDSALINSMVPPKIWKRYVDDSFVIIKTDAISAFHDTLNSIDPKILRSSPSKLKAMAKLPFWTPSSAGKMAKLQSKYIENLHTQTGI